MIVMENGTFVSDLPIGKMVVFHSYLGLPGSIHLEVKQQNLSAHGRPIFTMSIL